MGSGARDEFEQRFMGGGEIIVHRDKRVSRGMAAVLAGPGLFTLFLAVFVALVNDTSDKPVPAGALPFVVAGLAAFGLMFFALSLTFAVLRVVVTDGDVRVKYGLWGPTIPLDRLVSCEVVDYAWTRYGGWGIRRGADGSWAYVPASGKVVALAYEDGGKTKRVLVGASDATALAQKICQAKEARARRRVGPAPDAALDEAALDEAALEEAALAEAEAAVDQEQAARRG